MCKSILVILGIVLATAMSYAQEPWPAQNSEVAFHFVGANSADARSGTAWAHGETTAHSGYAPDVMLTKVDSDVTIALEPYNPPITIPPSGGDFECTVTVTINETTPLTFNVWTMATLP
ncbi:hypothetical protein AMJ71_02360, partial [candidate division TA06 bacterium SM1_40]